MNALARWLPTKYREFNWIYELKSSREEFRCLGRKLDALYCIYLASLRYLEELADYLEEINSA
ncbi:hypothetical protein F1880_007452 [Penicillium rolfsii]|nr:hypothetical protein F1880_007452 [Penicillium rolfsii]